MRLTEAFIPTIKETPNEAQIASHRLMLRAGMVRQTSAGIYAWLPLGLRVLRNIERIVREEQDACGAQELLMPTIQSADLWRESGRYDDYGAEMLRIRDRHERDMLYVSRCAVIASCRAFFTTSNGNSAMRSGRVSA
jgi:prolyl-tRNA synthetase